MRSLTTAAFLSSLFCFQVCNLDQATGQVFSKPDKGEIVNYQPSDPWTRGKVFNLQTGNSGLFYNCDGEQAKRCSPYICWKPDVEPMFPPLFEPLRIWKDQIDTVRQHIADGSCSDLCCSCADCRKARRNGQMGGCAACVQTASNRQRYSQANPRQSADAQTGYANSASVQQPAVDPAHGSKFGLVRGKIVEPQTPPQMTTPEVQPIRNTSVANKSLLDQLREMKRR